MPATLTTVHPLLAQRWSPRALDAEHVLDAATLDQLLEAARWAPSAANTQPWRFAVALRGTLEHARLLEALAPGNARWAHRASALVLVAATTADSDGNPLPWAEYDTGQAVAHLTTQATDLGLVVHQLGGFDREAAGRLLGRADVAPLVVLAIGRHDAELELPADLAAREGVRSRRAADELLLGWASESRAS